MTVAPRAIAHIPPPASATGPGRRSRWLVALAALTVGLASPLLCILHCLVLAPGAPGHSHGHHHMPVFICSFGAYSAASAGGGELSAASGREAAPRAIFESVATALAFGAPLLPLLPLARRPALRRSAPRSAPPPPPPKRAALARRHSPA